MELKSIGDAIRYVREHLYVTHDGRRHINQMQLYRLCKKTEEASIEDGTDLKRRFRAKSEDHQRKVVIEIENDQDDNQEVFILRTIARAMGLTENFFEIPFSSSTELESAFKSKSRADVKSISSAAPSEPPPSTAPVGFLQVRFERPIPTSRLLEAKRFDDAHLAGPHVPTQFILVEGRTGVGKSFFVGHWFRDHGRGTFLDRALCIDCSAISLDQILPQITEHFGSALNPGGEGSQPKHSEAEPTLIVLDGLRAEQFREGRATTSRGNAGERPFLRDLAKQIARLLTGVVSTTVMICLENNGPHHFEGYFTKALDSTIPVNRISLEPLSSDEGARFLKELGVNGLDFRGLEQISERVHGLPLALEAVASELPRLSDIERDNYLETLASTGSIDRGDDFSEFWDKYRSRIEATDMGVAEGNDPHPLALFRLLALMHGPMSLVHLKEIIDDQRITRLKNLKVESVVAGDYPFIAITGNANTVDLHIRVRGLLRSEIDSFVSNEKFDENTSRRELEWIHWRSAVLNWRSISRPSALSAFVISSIEAFVHHMMEQIKLLPQTGKGAVPQNRGYTSGVDHKMITRYMEKPGELNSSQLWFFAYHKAVRDYLLDQKHVPTRILGQYAAKARILQRLTSAVSNDIPVEPHNLAELYKEMSLCWMHAGFLSLARAAAYTARTLLADGEQRGDRSRKQIKRGATSELWRLKCDIASVQALIDFRSGRSIEECLSDLSSLQPRALEIVDENVEKFRLEGITSVEARGALRVIVRSADMALQVGDVKESIRLFGIADALQQQIRSRRLDGEAARRFCLALIRSPQTDGSHILRAQAVLDENIRHHETKAQNAGVESNDIIPFKIMAAGLARIKGDLSTAAKILEETRQHNFVMRGLCTYVAEAELSLEEIRYAIVQHGPSTEQREHAMRLKHRLGDMHHWQLSWEAALLAAECSTGAERISLLDQCEQGFSSTNNNLRNYDIIELRAGRSAIAKFGL